MNLKFTLFIVLIIKNNGDFFSNEFIKADEEQFNIYSFIHFAPNLLKHDYINLQRNPCYNKKIADGITSTRVYIYTTINIKNSIFYDMIRCALSKNGFFLDDEEIYLVPYNRKKFCRKTLKNQYSHYRLHLWLEWSVDLNLKSKKYKDDHYIYDYPFSCSPNIRNDGDVYIHMQLIGNLNELTEDSGERLRILETRPSNFINLINNEANILAQMDSDILPFIIAKTITGNGFGYSELILPDLMNQLFDYFHIANVLTTQPRWKNITKSKLNYVPPFNRYDSDDILQKDFAYIDNDN
uniref:Glycosyltransferase family 92 protein n=2 Tax=Strongyloides stercoralis TaxID=6248 RepID=A0A0K0EET3_STRER